MDFDLEALELLEQEELPAVHGGRCVNFTCSDSTKCQYYTAIQN